mmetsp:Transcript_12419/g.22616  ORF Transcript_12419/g.22616 Transcript_12419/m.22616 type:complete len:207 (-) Transcript_12419:384-1004(-)
MDVVDQLDSRRRGQQILGDLDVDLLLSLENDGLGMGPEGGDANGSATDGEVVGHVADLAGLPRDLHLLLGVAVLLEFVDVGDDVEGEGVGEVLVVGDFFLPAGHLDRPGLQLVHALLSGSAGGLVGGHEDSLGSELLHQGGKTHQPDGSGAVGVRDEVLPLARLPVDLRDDQRHIRLVTESGRVVDDDAALGDGAGVLEREVAANG